MIGLSEEQFELLMNKNMQKKITKFELNKRRNVLNVEQFMETFKYSNVSKLITTELIDYVVYSIMENINNLEEEEYPFVCSNAQTKQFYYKSNDEWIKGTDFIKNIYNKIYKNAMSQVLHKFKLCENIEGKDDDDTEIKYEASRDCEKQKILLQLCNCDKNPFDKVCDKVLIRLGKLIKHE
jgi:hypothetical protein